MSGPPGPATRLWRLAPWRHNELMRGADRFESVVVLFVVVLVLLLVPLAGAVGTATYDRLDLEMQAARAAGHPVDAVLIENARPSEEPTRGVPTQLRAPARWSVDGVEHTGDVDTARRATAGQTVAVWIGPDGDQAPPPRSGAANAAEAVATALVVWVAGTAGCAAVLSVFNWLATKRRLARWDREWERVGQSPGWPVV